MTFKLLKIRANLHKRNTLLQCWVATQVAAARHEKTGREATGKRGYVLGVSLASLTRFLRLFHKFAFKLQVGHRAVGLPATNDTEGQLSHADEDQHEVQDVPYSKNNHLSRSFINL